MINLTTLKIENVHLIRYPTNKAERQAIKWGELLAVTNNQPTFKIQNKEFPQSNNKNIKNGTKGIGQFKYHQ